MKINHKTLQQLHTNNQRITLLINKMHQQSGQLSDIESDELKKLAADMKKAAKYCPEEWTAFQAQRPQNLPSIGN